MEFGKGVWGDDDGDGFDLVGEDRVELIFDHGFGFSGRGDESLEWKVMLVGAGGRDDGFLNLHELGRSVEEWERGAMNKCRRDFGVTILEVRFLIWLGWWACLRGGESVNLRKSGSSFLVVEV